MTVTKELIRALNAAAQVDFDGAKTLLDLVNEVCGTKYGWLAKRVVFFDNPDADTATKYAHVHDLYVNL